MEFRTEFVDFNGNPKAQPETTKLSETSAAMLRYRLEQVNEVIALGIKLKKPQEEIDELVYIRQFIVDELIRREQQN